MKMNYKIAVLSSKVEQSAHGHIIGIRFQYHSRYHNAKKSRPAAIIDFGADFPTPNLVLNPILAAALEHARDPGADPALLVLAYALEAELARRVEGT
jgi:hypothetical protein